LILPIIQIRTLPSVPAFQVTQISNMKDQSMQWNGRKVIHDNFLLIKSVANADRKDVYRNTVYNETFAKRPFLPDFCVRLKF